MKIYAQREWHGIARKTPYDNDPFTSQIEINTEPGKGELKRLNSRSALLDSPFGAPAIRFNNIAASLSTSCDFDIFDYATHGTHQQAAICFKFNDLSSFVGRSGVDKFYLFWCGSIGCYYDTTNEDLRYTWNDDGGGSGSVHILSGAEPYEVNAWYWLSIWTEDGQNMQAAIHKDGNASTEDTDVNFVDCSPNYFQNAADRIYLGRLESPISIAYFCWRDDSGVTYHIDAWKPELVETNDVDKIHFLPRDPRKTIFPGQINSSTTKASWVLYPRPGITLAEDTDAYEVPASFLEETNVKGIASTCGRGHILDLAGEDVFSRHTVFMFSSKTSVTPRGTYLRSFDSKFSMYGDGTDLNVRWMPDSVDSDVSAGGFCIVSVALATVLAFTEWIALEFDPNNEDESDANPLFSLYGWNGSEWEAIAWDSTFIPGTGVDSPDTSEWKLFQMSQSGATNDGTYRQCLLDFRVIIGDTSWTSTYTPGDTLSSIPSTLVYWLNLDDSNYWPKDENCKTISIKNDDHVDEIVAVSDRVTGSYKLFPDRYASDVQWEGCEHLDKCFYPTPEDVRSDVSGNVYGPTDGSWYDNSDCSPLIQSRSPARRKCSTIGTHNYVSGGGQLQRANIPNKPVRFPSVFVTVGAEVVSSGIHPNTHVDEGSLSYDTQYQFKTTLYDPATGNESNPHGGFWFDTGDYSGASSDQTCSADIDVYVESNVDVSSYVVKFYRYHSATGTYRYEGFSGIEAWTDSATYSEGRLHKSSFNFSISDTELALRSSLAEDNNDPPYHVYSALWAGRAWYIPAVNQSRVNFSKLYYFSECPTTNVCWTDEGATGDILGLMPGFGGLLLLKENSIWIIPQADNAAGYMAQLLIPDIGVVSADAAVFVNGVLWFADNSGIYTFDGSSIQQVSDKLDGLERNVWDGNPRKTRAYYDKENWKVVFVCEGTAITFDSRTGAASLCGLPDSCYGFMSSSDYSGPLYGQDGMIMKEFKGNMGLALTDEDYEQGGNTYGPAITFSYENGDISDLTAITEYWSDGTNSGSAVIGYTEPGIGDSTTTFLNISSVVGSTFTQWNTDDISVTRDYDIHCNTIHMSPDINTIYLKALPGTGLTEYYLGIVPMYYKSQNLYFDVDQSDKIIEQLSVLFGDWVKGVFYNYYSSNGEEYLESNKYCPVVTVDYTAETLGEYFTSNEVTSGEEAFIEDRYFFRLPVQRKGYRGYYEVLSKAIENIPPVKSIFLHYNVLRPRGGGKYR